MKIQKLPHFLADTWWYAITKRVSDEAFIKLVELRERQGFTAAQLVVGIPPEIGYDNENAKSVAGSAWDKNGNINHEYLEYAKKRIKIMNEHHLTAVIYGAWGQQIDWMGEKFMCKWWDEIIKEMDDLDVIYCVTGEVDLFIDPDNALRLLPNKTSSDIEYIYRDLDNEAELKAERYRKWEYVLEHIRSITTKPVIIHPWIEARGESGYNFSKKRYLLSANTFQTGHDEGDEDLLWKRIYDSKKRFPGIPAINLEPCYEGIKDTFYTDAQIMALWMSISAGAYAICYGAHGIWNASDGTFLAQWGGQTFEEALKLKSPELLGKTYQMILKEGILDWEQVEAKTENEKLISMTRISDDGRKIIYIPQIEKFKNPPEGRYFDILKAEFSDAVPQKGQAVIFAY